MPVPRAVVLMLVGGLVLATVAVAADPAPTFADVAYGSHGHQRLDIYLPTKGDGPFPAILWYGGLWKPARHPARLDYFGKAGCAVIAVQLRTMTEAQQNKEPAPVAYVMNDAVRAVQFVRWNAAKYKLNPERLAVGGGSQGALPALYVACVGDRADPKANDPVERVSSLVRGAAAYRSQPSIDPRQLQDWVPGVKWGAPALGCTFEESLRRRDELLPIIAKWSPDHLLHRGTPPLYFENEWGLTKPADVTQANYDTHSPAFGLGFQKLAQKAGVVCHVKYAGHPTDGYADIWDFIVQELKKNPS